MAENNARTPFWLACEPREAAHSREFPISPRVCLSDWISTLFCTPSSRVTLYRTACQSYADFLPRVVKLHVPDSVERVSVLMCGRTDPCCARKQIESNAVSPPFASIECAPWSARDIKSRAVQNNGVGLLLKEIDTYASMLATTLDGVVVKTVLGLVQSMA